MADGSSRNGGEEGAESLQRWINAESLPQGAESLQSDRTSILVFSFSDYFFLIRIYTLTNVPPVQRLMDLNRNGAESLSLPMCCTDPSYYFFYFQIIFGPTWN